MRRIDWLAVVALLLLAFGFRVMGQNFNILTALRADGHMVNGQGGFHPDEFLFVAHPLQMALSGDLTPEFYENPSFLINANFVIFGLTNTGAGLSHDERQALQVNFRDYAPYSAFMMTRVWSALGGLLAVAAIYGAIRHISGLRGALIAGLLVAVSFPLVQHGHYATTSSIATGFVAVSLWAAVISWRYQSAHALFITAIFAGLATGSRYNAAIIGIVVLLTALNYLWHDRSRRGLTVTVTACALFPLTFLFTTPFVLVDMDKFIQDIRYISNQYLGEGLVDPLLGLWLEQHYLIVFGVGVPAFLLSIAGAMMGILRRSTRVITLIVGVFIVLYSGLILRTVRPTGADQILLPLLPAYALLAGIAAGWLLNRRSAIVTLVVALVTVAIPLSLSAQFVALITQTDTRARMRDWVYDHIPTDQRILLIAPYNVPLDTRYDFDQQFFTLRDVPLDELAAYDILITSDAVLHKEIVSPVPRFPATANDPAMLEDDPRFETVHHIATIARPMWAGHDWAVQTASFWHHPALNVYCMNAAACSALSIE